MITMTTAQPVDSDTTRQVSVILHALRAPGISLQSPELPKAKKNVKVHVKLFFYD